MSAKRFRQVLVLAETGSFRRAATILEISQPALTKAVQSLERELGVLVFDRQRRGVTLTEYGKRVVAYAKGLVESEDNLLHDLTLIAGLETGRVNVALGPYPSVISGYAAAARLSKDHPKLAIGLRVADWRAVTKAIADRQVDVGIAELTDALANEALASEAVGAHRARFFCRPGHSILRHKRIALADLLQFPWVTTRLPPRVAAAFPRPPGPAGRIDEATGDFIPAIELDVPMQLAAFARESDALALGTFAMVEHELRAGTLVVVPSEQFDMRARYGFVWLRHRSLSPAALAYMQAVRAEERRYIVCEARLAAVYERKRPRSLRT